MRKLRQTGFILFLLATFLSCSSSGVTQHRERDGNMSGDYNIPSGCDFASIGHKYSSNPCSPQIVNPDYVGVLINLPAIVELKDGMDVPVACSYAHDVSQALRLTKPLKNSIVFIAVDKSTNETFSGSFRDIENRVPPPPRQKGAEEQSVVTAKKIVGGYLNVDLVELLSLPQKVAKYYVYATVANYKSNVVDLEIRKGEGK